MNISFSIDGDLIRAACECTASRREAIGSRCGLAYVCFNANTVVTTDSYVLFEACGVTGEHLPKFLLLEPSLFAKVRATDTVHIYGETDTPNGLTIEVEPRKGAKTIQLASAEEVPFPQSYKDLLKVSKVPTETWAFRGELMEKAMKASSKLRDRGIWKMTLQGPKPLVMSNDYCKLLIANAKEV